MEETILFKIDVDVDAARQAIVDYQVQLDRLRKEKKLIEEANKRGELSEQEYAKKIIETNEAIKKVSDSQKEAQKQLDLASKAAKVQKNSYQELSLQYAEARKKLTEMADAIVRNEDGTITLSEAYKEQAEKVRQLKEAQIAFDQALADGRTNVGNYTDSIKEAFSEFSVFGVSVKSLQAGFQSLKEKGIKGVLIEFLDLSKAILASPLGIFLTLLGSFVAIASRSKAITGALGQAFNAFGQVLDTVFQLLEPVIEGVAKLISFGAEALSSLASLFNSSSENIAKLNGELQDVNDALDLAVQKQAEANLEAQKYKNIVEDTSEATEKRLEAARKQFESQKKAVDATLALEQRKAEILQKQLSTMGNTNKAFELRKQLSEQNAKISELLNEQEKAREELIIKTNELLRTQQADLLALQQAQLNLDIATGKVREGSFEQLQREIKLLEEKKNLALEAEKDETRRQTIIISTEAEIAKKRADFQKKAVEDTKKQNEEFAEIAKKRIETQNTIASDVLATEKAIIEQQLSNLDLIEKQRLAAVKAGSKAALQIVREVAEERNRLQQQLVEKEKAIEDENLRQKLQAIVREARERKKLGIDTAKFVAEETRRAEAESNLRKMELQNKFASEQIETAKSIAEQLREISNEESAKTLQNEIELQKNAIAQKRLLGELATQEQIELAKNEHSLKLEQLRQALENEDITQAEFDNARIQAKIEYENKINEIEAESLRVKTEAVVKQIELQQQVLQSFASIVEGFAAFAEENEEAAKAFFVFQKSLALAEVAINLQKELAAIAANSVLNADPTQISKGIAIAAAIARGLKIVAEIKKATFAEGGFTGEGSKYEVAGIVHKNEYVVPKWQVEDKRFQPLLAILEASRLRGYATGGLVGGNIFQASNVSLFSDFAKAMQLAPAPIVDVREVVSVAKRVQAVENIAKF